VPASTTKKAFILKAPVHQFLKELGSIMYDGPCLVSAFIMSAVTIPPFTIFCSWIRDGHCTAGTFEKERNQMNARPQSHTPPPCMTVNRQQSPTCASTRSCWSGLLPVQTHVRLTIENILKVCTLGSFNPGRLNRRVRWSNGERAVIALISCKAVMI
jgi:hypothetical protein